MEQASDPSTGVDYTLRTLQRPALTLVTARSPEPFPLLEFARAMFPDRGLAESEGAPGWRALRSAGGEWMAFREDEIIVQRRGRWQRFVGNLAVNQVLALQRGTLFFHAAGVGIGGSGIMLFGAKGSGKTTLSLGLAARGHRFLSDEIVGVRIASRELVGCRRVASVREGPQAAAVARALHAAPMRTERYPDGTVRRRAPVGELFPGTGTESVPFRRAVVLHPAGSRTRWTPFAPSPDRLADFPPLRCSLWGSPLGLRTIQLLSVLSRVTCFDLIPGSVEETVDAIEQLAEVE